MRTPDLSITGRLAIGFGAVLLLVAAEAAIYLGRYQQVEKLEAQRSQVIEPAYEIARDLRTSILQRGVSLRSYALTGEERFRDDADREAQAWAVSFARLEHLESAADPGLLEEIALQEGRYGDAARAFEGLVRAQAAPEQLTSAERALDATREASATIIGTLIHDVTANRETMLVGVERARQQARDSFMIFSVLLACAVGLTGLLTARSVRRPALKLLHATRALNDGNFEPALALAPAGSAPRRHRNELQELAEGFGRTTSTLQKRERRMAAQAALSAALAAASEVEPLAAAVLTRLAEFAPVQLSALFLLDESSGTLHRVGGYAAEGTPSELRLGEGLPGQAAATRQRLIVRDLPSDLPWKLQLGGQSLTPRMVVATPILFEQKLVGLLLLASVHELDEDAISFVDDAASQVAVSLVNALANRKVRELAAELHEKNGLLKAQNDELQEQAEEIQAQNEELQAQTEEIQAQNDDLLSREELLRAQNTELDRQQKELALADRQKDEFLSIASHELRTPITTLKLLAHQIVRRIERHADWEEVLPGIRSMDQQTTRLSDLVTRMLDASRATMRRLEVRPREMDLAELVRQAASQAQVRTTKHTVVVQGVDASLTGCWDSGYLEQVIVNLLENAIRYSPEGGEILVSLSRRGENAVLQVTDHGIGIPEEAQGKLFRPYFRHDGAKAVASEGLGLGLYVTHEIVVAHGGQIEVRSRPGEGTTFTVELPCEHHAAHDSEVFAASA